MDRDKLFASKSEHAYFGSLCVVVFYFNKVKKQQHIKFKCACINLEKKLSIILVVILQYLSTPCGKWNEYVHGTP